MRVVIQPTEEPISLAEAKLHLRVDQNDEDALISALIVTARKYCELVQGRAYVTQTIEQVWNYWPREMTLPMPPLQSVESVTYRERDGTIETVPAADYIVDLDSYVGRVVPVEIWPMFDPYPVNPVRVRYVAGYGNAAQVPEMEKQAMLLLIGEMYETRENSAEKVRKEVLTSTHTLLQPERVW